MKVLLLAGGLGTRLAEETGSRPKPMVEIGGRPILWHIMRLYSHYGFNEFVILTGYKGFYIKEYFANYFLHMSDVTIDIRDGSMKVHNNESEPWRITLLDTGLDTMTGGRIKRAQPFVGDQPFLLTYGDGVADIDLAGLVRFHKSHGKAITMTSAQPDARFGAVEIGDNMRVKSFSEKPKNEGGWINAGFFVCERRVFDYISDGDVTVFEQDPLRNLARDEELYTWQHDGFWRPMDTLRDKHVLEDLWQSQQAPWKVW